VIWQLPGCVVTSVVKPDDIGITERGNLGLAITCKCGMQTFHRVSPPVPFFENVDLLLPCRYCHRTTFWSWTPTLPGGTSG
jgi:hypothetical protein